MSKVRANLKINSIQSVFTVMILPHQAVVYLDAVIRTLYRLGRSKKSLLEWTTASKTESISPNSLGAYFQYMMFPVLLGLMILAVSVFTVPHYLWIMIPFSLLWTGSPIYVWYASRPVKVRHIPFSEDEKLKLRTYARRTWFYFERFVNEDHSWLPPDNYQEDPPLSPVDRTSPTNIGLALVSVHVAYNMGYITFGELLERQQNTLESMSKLERHKGHFFNWYETKLGEALSPRYVSTVDSGNLAASLIVVKEAVKQGMQSRGINKKLWSGMQDTIITLREIFESYNKHDVLPQQSHERITLFTSSMMDKLRNINGSDTFERLTLLKSLKEDATKLSAVDLLPMGSRLGDREMSDLYFWLESPLKQIENAILEYRCITSSKDVDLRKFSPNELYELKRTENSNQPCVRLLKKWKSQAEYIITSCETFTDEMDFSFLYLKKRGLFSIGYNEEKAQLDKGTYDLLASEARIASYFAISKGDIPVEHWFRLSRRLTSLNQNEILLSWSGTMFEYLMPLLFMRSYPDTLMSHTYHNVIQWQQEYGKQRNQPWGFSESAYHFLNIDMHYQYRAFGAPGLGLKRGLAEEYVVAPYATMLALMVKPKISLENLKEIEQLGGLGLYGFYDAVDFTPSHLSDKVPFKVVKTYMAHHHGMSLIAIENLLNEWSINHYFHSDAKVRGCELLLQEKIPMGIPIKEPHPIDVELEPGEQETVQNIVEPSGIDELDISPPRLHILSNGSYSTFVTHAGTGSSKCRGIALNSWDPDPTIDPSGMFFYIKDLKTDRYWSAMHQPVKCKPDRYDTWFHNGKIVTSRVDDWIETTTEICVSPDHEIEFRKIILTNYSDRIRNLELTSYAEVVLNRLEDHRSHPAFSKLFVQTDYLAEHHSVIAKRRPRSDDEKPVWLIHTFAGHDQDNVSEPLQFETERSNFIGRGRSLGNPAAMDKGYKLKGSLGNVSDPIVSLRETIELEPGEKIQFTFGLGMAYSREEAVHIADIYDNQHATNRAFDLATVYSTVELNHIDITPKQAHYYQKLASYALYSDPKFRGNEKRLKENRKKQQDLWAYGISGDLPLFVFRINDTDQLKRVKTLLKAHAFWRLKGLETELLILNDHPPSYADEVQEAIHQSIETSMDRERLNKRGGVFVHKTDKMPENDLTLILSVAHAVFEQKLPTCSNLYRHPKQLPGITTLNRTNTQYRL
jgi:cyclic beta-1,2-glucan synthetase